MSDRNDDDYLRQLYGGFDRPVKWSPAGQGNRRFTRSVQEEGDFLGLESFNQPRYKTTGELSDDDDLHALAASIRRPRDQRKQSTATWENTYWDETTDQPIQQMVKYNNNTYNLPKIPPVNADPGRKQRALAITVKRLT